MSRSGFQAFVVACFSCVSSLSYAQDASDAPAESSIEQVERCVAQHASARQLLLQERWLDARAAMSRCAEPQCPLAILSDCRAWLDELTRMLPTALILVERAASAPLPLRVELDAQSIALPEPPAPLELLPGRHRLRLFFADRPPLVLDFALEKGEKNHIERLTVSPPLARKAPPTAKRSLSRPVPGATYFFGGAAVAAFASSATLLATALRERGDARATCAPACEPSVRKSIETRLILADASGALGLVLSTLAVYSFVQRGAVLSAGSSPALALTQGGLGLSLRGGF